jgi:hypothetical protein
MEVELVERSKLRNILLPPEILVPAAEVKMEPKGKNG